MNINKKLFDIDSPPIPLFKEQTKNLRAKTVRTFDFTQAVPSFSTFPRIIDALAHDLKNTEMSFYTDVPGLKDLREKMVQTHPMGAALTMENVLIAAGANQAMYMAMTLLFNIGDRVMLLEPYYFNHDMALKMLGLQPEYFSLPFENGFQLDVDKMISHMESADVRGLVLISPNNPTGASYPCHEIARLLRWTSMKGIEVILDETYLRFDPDLDNKSLMTPFLGNGLTCVGSFSKTCSLTGYRVGYFIGSPFQVQESCKIQDTMIICPAHLSQRAALHGLTLCEADIQSKVAETEKLGQMLKSRGKELNAVRLMSVGAFIAYLKHPYEADAEAAAKSLYQGARILVLPGTIFGASQKDFIRLSFANVNEGSLSIALDQLIEYDRTISN